MEKTYRSTQKFILESPRKLRLVVALAKKMKPVDAVEKLPFSSKRAGLDLAKVIKSAIANARVAGASDADLIFKEIQIGEGPRLKRGQAASRGRYHQFKKRMSHIRVVLTTRNSQLPNSKSQMEDKTKEGKKQNTEKTKLGKKTVKKGGIVSK